MTNGTHATLEITGKRTTYINRWPEYFANQLHQLSHVNWWIGNLNKLVKDGEKWRKCFFDNMMSWCPLFIGFEPVRWRHLYNGLKTYKIYRINQTTFINIQLLSCNRIMQAQGDWQVQTKLSLSKFYNSVRWHWLRNSKIDVIPKDHIRF